MPTCDCGCCRTGCRDCDEGCTSRQAELIDDDGGYSDYLAARAA